MKEQQKQIRDWMQKFGQETPEGGPVIPSIEVRKLRAKLILEEALETIEGLGLTVKVSSNTGCDRVWLVDNCEYVFSDKAQTLEPSLVSIADGIADSLVVQLGTAVACGIDIQPVFEEVMRSNNQKLWSDDEDLDQQEMARLSATGERKNYTVTEVDHHPEIDISLYLVKDSTGKVIKPPSWKPPEIGKILEKQINNQ